MVTVKLVFRTGDPEFTPEEHPDAVFTRDGFVTLVFHEGDHTRERHIPADLLDEVIVTKPRREFSESGGLPRAGSAATAVHSAGPRGLGGLVGKAAERTGTPGGTAPL